MNQLTDEQIDRTRNALDCPAGILCLSVSDTAWLARAIIAAHEAQRQVGPSADVTKNGALYGWTPLFVAPQPAKPDQAGEIAALRRDAERYCWLRSIGHDQTNVLGHYAGDAMDAAIDTAIAQPEQTKEKS